MLSIAGQGESSASHPKAARACSRFAICARSRPVLAEEAFQLHAPRGLDVVVEHLDHGVLHPQGRAELEVVELLGGARRSNMGFSSNSGGGLPISAPGGAKKRKLCA
jgi:hypothetical protein